MQLFAGEQARLPCLLPTGARNPAQRRHAYESRPRRLWLDLVLTISAEKPALVRQYVEMVKTICIKHQSNR